MNTKPNTDLQAILKVNGYNPVTTQYLNIEDLVPEDLNFIWNTFSEGCPFSFGDNNITLIDAITIRNWVDECYEMGVGDLSTSKWKKAEKALGKFIELMNLCFDAGVYINIE